MRILWVSNAGWSHQGYGVQVQGLLPHLVAQGHDLAVFAFWGLEGGKVRLPLAGDTGGIELVHYPRLVDAYGNDAVALHAQDFGADCVITLMDVWVCDPGVYKELHWLAWLPIDQEPIPEPVLARLPHMLRALPYSRFGERLIQQTSIPCTYIPHGVDTKVFQPFSAANRERAKRTLGFEGDEFVVGMVGANKGFPSRKGFPEAFQAFKKLRESVPQARLYVHSQVSSQHGGPNLQHLAELCGISAYVRFPDQYQLAIGLPQEAMAIAYNAMDVLLQASSHEGFGLPILEAQACGTPVVAVDSTSMRELVAPGYSCLVGSLQPQLTTLMAWVAVPDIRGLAKALRKVFEEPPSDVERTLIRGWAEQYDWRLVAEHYWRPLLDQVAEQLGAPSSQDRALKQALEMPTVLAEPPHLNGHVTAEVLEGDRHGCCCQHVVEELEAMPAEIEVRLGIARGKLQECPHQEASNWLETLVNDLQTQLHEVSE